MHEMSLVRNVVDIVLDECKDQNVKSVKAVHLTIGELSDVVEHFVSDMFRFLARGTIAAEAEVIIKRTPFLVRCTDCGEIFRINVHNESTWACPRCGAQQKYTLFSGREFRIDSIDIETAYERSGRLVG